MTRLDHRSPEAARYRKLYKTREWAALRKLVLTRDGYRCKLCGVVLTSGRKSARSAVVHHKEAHKGNHSLFFDQGNLEASCKRCHDGVLQSEEVRGYSLVKGENGWPTDPKHPANR